MNYGRNPSASAEKGSVVGDVHNTVAGTESLGVGGVGTQLGMGVAGTAAAAAVSAAAAAIMSTAAAAAIAVASTAVTAFAQRTLLLRLVAALSSPPTRSGRSAKTTVASVLLSATDSVGCVSTATAVSTKIVVAASVTCTTASTGREDAVLQGNATDANIGTTTSTAAVVSGISTAVPAAGCSGWFFTYVNVKYLTWGNAEGGLHTAAFAAQVLRRIGNCSSTFGARQIYIDGSNSSGNGPGLNGSGVVECMVARNGIDAC